MPLSFGNRYVLPVRAMMGPTETAMNRVCTLQRRSTGHLRPNRVALRGIGVDRDRVHIFTDSADDKQTGRPGLEGAIDASRGWQILHHQNRSALPIGARLHVTVERLTARIEYSTGPPSRRRLF